MNTSPPKAAQVRARKCKRRLRKRAKIRHEDMPGRLIEVQEVHSTSKRSRKLRMGQYNRAFKNERKNGNENGESGYAHYFKPCLNRIDAM